MTKTLPVVKKNRVLFITSQIIIGGVLVLLGNYTGDRLNFGKAFEKAKVAGIKVCDIIYLFYICGISSNNI